MAGRPYQLPQPQPDVQPKSFGAEPRAYEQGLRPRPLYAQPTAATRWRDHSAPITHALHCNISPRISMAPLLDAAAARDLGVTPLTPGRRPAPRFEPGCPPGPEELPEPTGALARDLLTRKPQRQPLSPDGGPGAGPGPKPPGLDPLPPPPPPRPRTPPPRPTPPAPTEETAPEQPQDVGPPLQPPSHRIPGTLRTINFHFTQSIPAGATTSEIRVHGPIPSPFMIRELWINSESTVTAGQYLDILVAADGDTTDTTNPTGQSIFETIIPPTGDIGRDLQRGIAIPPTLQQLQLNYLSAEAQRHIKVRHFYIAPATTLAQLHVTMILELLDRPELSPPAPQPRPPATPPATPPPTRNPTDSRLGAGWIIPQILATGTRDPLRPAWLVAAQGLEPRRLLSGSLATYPAIEAYAAWHLQPNSDAASAFQQRINRVLERAGVTGDGHTLVRLSARIPPGE